MQTQYDPEQIEAHWSKEWEQQGYFQPTGDGDTYSIALPPPNVTGTLHMGHGFQISLMDALIRRARMQGKQTLWQPGTDHAGIATQMVVERQLAQENKSRHDLGRDNFIERVWQWREESGSNITHQMRRLGASMDWSRQRFSMDEDITLATYTAFIKLYEDGLVYRGKRLVNWDTKFNTAISDLEVENKQKQGHLWHIRYPLSDGSGHVVVATTRPETMLGDTAVAVHPEDERYQNLIGKSIKLPLTDREIPVIADDYVDKEFGSGCVKITPAHDFNDHDMGKRHNLAMINIMTFDGHLNDEVPANYRGLERFAARKQIIADLEAAGLLEKTEDHTNSVPYGDRSGTVIEPMLTDQWFVKASVLAKPAIEAVKTGALKFVPENWTKTYLQWLENIQDWCISRQLWWGHRIPVWYDADSNIYVGLDEADARQRHQLSDDIELKQDEDVFDTWFTASLWPFSSLGWPENTEALKNFYPTSVLVTGFDIIFFWVARMVMMGLHFLGEVPFKEVYITGLIRDSHGQKMSKSKGNVLDPIDLIDGITLDPLVNKRTKNLMLPKLANKVEKSTRKEFPEGIAAHGTDALRFTFCALATTGRDINFDMGRIEGYRNFCNKLWNASRFVLMNTENYDPKNNQRQFSLADKWITSEFEKTIERVNTEFERYRFDLVAQALYEFTWNQYCDWYLELAKCTLYNDSSSADEKNGTQYTLLTILEQLLRLMHPLMPYITEEIWQTVADKLGNPHQQSLMLESYPASNPKNIDAGSIEEISWLQEFITIIRNLRSEIGISPAKGIPLIISKSSEKDHQRIKHCELYLESLTKIESIAFVDDQELPLSASSVLGSMEIHIPLAGLIDKSSELSRLDKEIKKLQVEQEKSQNKLGNPNYAAKAPEAVVQKERDRLLHTTHTLEKLKSYYLRIETL
jgi:valyl-tRNA synthetase